MSEREPSQAWFWTPEWQAGEAEADEQAERGEGDVYFLPNGDGRHQHGVSGAGSRIRP